MEGQMNKVQIRAACVEALVEVTGNLACDCKDDTHLLNDFGMDDLDIVETVMEIESELGVTIPGSGDAYPTFGQLVDAACKAKGVEV